MNDDADSARQGSNSTAIGALMTLLLLLYAFSIGPVAFMFNKYPALQPMQDPAAAFYAPVFWLDEHTSLKQPIDSYLEWWVRLAFK